MDTVSAYGFVRISSNLAASHLKYGIVVIPNENAQLFYYSPFTIEKSVGIFELITTNFFAFIVAYCSHLFGVLDWGYIETYIVDFYPISRIIGSLFLYSYWLVAFYGVFIFIRKEKSVKERFICITLLGSFILYWGFIGTTIIESRFGYPLFLILLPFSGIGICNITQMLKNHRTDKKIYFKRLILFATLYLVLILVLLYISFLFDYQTGRINWLGF